MDVNAFSQNLLKLIEDESLRKKLASNGRNNVQKRFSYQQLTVNMRTLYNELLDSKD